MEPRSNDTKEKRRGHNYRMKPLRKDNKLRVLARGMGGGMELRDVSLLRGRGLHCIN